MVPWSICCQNRESLQFRITKKPISFHAWFKYKKSQRTQKNMVDRPVVTMNSPLTHKNPLRKYQIYKKEKFNKKNERSWTWEEASWVFSVLWQKHLKETSELKLDLELVQLRRVWGDRREISGFLKFPMGFLGARGRGCHSCHCNCIILSRSNGSAPPHVPPLPNHRWVPPQGLRPNRVICANGSCPYPAFFF